MFLLLIESLMSKLQPSIRKPMSPLIRENVGGAKNDLKVSEDVWTRKSSVPTESDGSDPLSRFCARRWEGLRGHRPPPKHVCSPLIQFHLKELVRAPTRAGPRQLRRRRRHLRVSRGSGEMISTSAGRQLSGSGRKSDGETLNLVLNPVLCAGPTGSVRSTSTTGTSASTAG